MKHHRLAKITIKAHTSKRPVVGSTQNVTGWTRHLQDGMRSYETRIKRNNGIRKGAKCMVPTGPRRFCHTQRPPGPRLDEGPPSAISKWRLISGSAMPHGLPKLDAGHTSDAYLYSVAPYSFDTADPLTSTVASTLLARVAGRRRDAS